ncbi:TonB-dependent siderophore receptor [Entomomonas sp. E2T0]|uniref:TonB-dependent siderophore receptor n=1 Tax=Entomomonas sp. E2T0 TaxID=2930213 RepID=UPI0022283FC2|nr:TonB-dependent siderophore receptor [Entomomonas sp. E2T0]UYZ84086.1 TonB-dependent siderophore receptor [Entomomonas sp. E2T0]
MKCRKFVTRQNLLFLLVTSICLPVLAQIQITEEQDNAIQLDTLEVLGTAQEELKQAPGVSIITAEDIRKSPPVNDISEILRKQPGVNLTGNSGSGARGNNRQVDIRGMGPENTLILVDGKPISSKNSVRYGWRGDRDTRGDTNWVPADQIERIEILRGPAAARYGSGAAGGVINIITKGTTQEHHGNVTIYRNMPQHKSEGVTKRIDFGLSGPLADNLSYRIYGNLNKTDADDKDINKNHTIGNFATAGREGVRNKDINGLIKWQFTPEQSLEFEAGFSRQGNIYAGDSMNNSSAAALQAFRDPWIGRETNIIYRENFAITHRGKWDNLSSMSFFQYEKTRNRRLQEGLAGGPEGNINSNDFGTISLRSLTGHSEVNIPFYAVFDQVVTLGTEWNEQKMDDPFSNTQTVTEGGSIPSITGTNRNTKSSATISSLFVENNIELRPGTIVTPGLRYDHHTTTGSNWSPALNISQDLTDTVTLKAGIAHAYKAPNLYQTNPNYLLYSRGNGCWGAGGSCYLMGNKNLKAETSVNKELGIEYKQDGWIAGITWFRNDYKNKIEAGQGIIGTATGGTGSYVNSDIFQWDNVPKAVVEGLEGNLTIPLHYDLTWTNNFTYMLQSKNKTTGEPLSIIPEFTINSTMDWQATDALSLQTTATWYGRQTPPKYDYQGKPVSKDGKREISPYVLVGFSGSYEFTKNLRVTLGVNNIFDKRLYREGNSKDAGAYTYNEPGRTLYTSITASF